LEPQASGFTLPIAITPQLTLWRLLSQSSALLYEGFDRRTGARVAVKLIAQARDESVRARILQDAAQHANLEHPNILPILDVATLSDGTPYVVTEFVSGQTLADALQSARPTRALACEVTSHLLAALVMLHHAGLVHGHLAPSHIFVQTAPQGASRVRLLDTGFARVELLPARFDALSASPQSQESLALRYAAPEQLVAGAENARSDLYSLGLLLHEMLTGVCPHADLAPVELVAARVRAEIDDVHLVRAGVGSTLSRFVLTALERDPSARFASAEEMLCELHAARADESCLWRRTTEPELAPISRIQATEPILAVGVVPLASQHPPQSPLDSAIWTPEPQLTVSRRAPRGGMKTWLVGFGVTLAAGAALLLPLEGPTDSAQSAARVEPLRSAPATAPAQKPAPLAAPAAALGQASGTTPTGSTAGAKPGLDARTTDTLAAGHAASANAAQPSHSESVLSTRAVASPPGEHPPRVAKRSRARSETPAARSRPKVGNGQPAELPANPY
jgi:serine/threonine-protein kinase